MLKPILHRFIPCSRAKNILSSGSFSENQIMESLSFVHVELNRINNKHYSLHPCPPTHDYTDIPIPESGKKNSKYLFLITKPNAELDPQIH